MLALQLLTITACLEAVLIFILIKRTTDTENEIDDIYEILEEYIKKYIK